MEVHPVEDIAMIHTDTASMESQVEEETAALKKTLQTLKANTVPAHAASGGSEFTEKGVIRQAAVKLGGDINRIASQDPGEVAIRRASEQLFQAEMLRKRVEEQRALQERMAVTLERRLSDSERLETVEKRQVCVFSMDVKIYVKILGANTPLLCLQKN